MSEMKHVKTNITLDGAGIICLGIGIGILQGGEDYLMGGTLTVLGAGLLALKYYLR